MLIYNNVHQIVSGLGKGGKVRKGQGSRQHSTKIVIESIDIKERRGEMHSGTQQGPLSYTNRKSIGQLPKSSKMFINDGQGAHHLSHRLTGREKRKGVPLCERSALSR
jgi:hypothetical protein